MKVVIFTGGTGGTKLVQGLDRLVAPEDLTVVVNTGDDIEWWGLHVSPDIDSVLYGLSGALSVDRGWGVNDDSFRCLERMKRLGEPAWFSLGDLDLATHLVRTSLLRGGRTLTEATAELARRMKIRCARTAHVRRSRFDHAGDGEGPAEFSGILRARAAQRRGQPSGVRGRRPVAACAGRAAGDRFGGGDCVCAE